MSSRFLSVFFLAALASAQDAPVSTHHQITIKGRALVYTAEAGRIAIRDVETGEPHGQMFYIAYRVSSPKPRPIAFIWNGGPGWPSLPLHFEVAGPLRGEGDRLIDNEDTWLADSDLVFVDPIGTGFSRATKPEYVKEFAIDIGDVMAETEFIRCWLLLHNAEQTPFVIAGESYGSARASRVGYALLKRGFPLTGLVLISGGNGLPAFKNSHTVDWAMHVADMAVLALSNHKTPSELGSTPDAVRANVEQWIHDRYLPALSRLATLTDAERDQIAKELAMRTGLNPDQIRRSSLLLSSQNWFGVISVNGKRPLVSDFRRSEAQANAWMPAALRYLRRDLGYHTDLPYIGADGGETLQQGFAPTGKYPLTMNGRWVHSLIYDPTPEQFAQAEADFAQAGMLGFPTVGTMPSTAEAILLNPKLKVLVAQGTYDPLGGCSINAEHSRHLDAPYRTAVDFKCYVGGHMIYRDTPARTLFSNDVKALLRAAAK